MNIRFSSLLAVLLAAPVAAMAQNAPGPATPTTQNAPAPATAGAHGGHHHGYLRMLKSLDLSDAQTQQVKAIVRNTKSQNANVTDPAVRKANMKAMRQSIEAVLTPDQLGQLKSEMKQMREERRSGDAPSDGSATGGGSTAPVPQPN